MSHVSALVNPKVKPDEGIGFSARIHPMVSQHPRFRMMSHFIKYLSGSHRLGHIHKGFNQVL